MRAHRLVGSYHLTFACKQVIAIEDVGEGVGYGLHQTDGATLGNVLECGVNMGFLFAYHFGKFGLRMHKSIVI